MAGLGSSLPIGEIFSRSLNLLGGGVKEPRLGWEIALVNYPHTDCQRGSDEEDDPENSSDSPVEAEGDNVPTFIFTEG